MRPFRSRVQTKLFILFACKNSLLKKKAGEEEKKENETKSFGTTNQKNRSKKVFYCCSRQILSLSLSLMKSFRLSFFSALSKYLFSSIDR
tara:strand:+ start:184 stop:453 length:270 start_codon:yes stop_codon:yes gene_type:complete